MQKWKLVTRGKTFNFSRTYKFTFQESGRTEFILGMCAWVYLCLCVCKVTIHALTHKWPKVNLTCHIFRICSLCFWNWISHWEEDSWGSCIKLSKRLSGQQVPCIYLSLPPQSFLVGAGIELTCPDLHRKHFLIELSPQPQEGNFVASIQLLSF